MGERKQEINFIVNLIQKFCEEANICLIAKENKGVRYVAVQDNETGTDYAMVEV